MSDWAKKVGAITLFVDDLVAARSFFGEVFGMPIVYEDEASTMFNFGNIVVNLLRSSEAHELIEPAVVAPAEGGSRLQLTIFVSDVDGVCRELASRGVKLLNGPLDRDWGMRTAAFADPAGHIWEVAQDIS